MSQESQEQRAVVIEQRGRVLLAGLSRPNTLNALNEALRDGLVEALDRAESSDDIGAMVITGHGRAFSAGGDLQRFAELYAAGDPDAVEEFTDLEFPRRLAAFPKPLIAAINGPAVGWGFTMPLMCDIRLAAKEAVFSAAFVKIGLTPEFGSSFFLPRIVGLGRAMELVLSARIFEPDEALAMGLVSEVLDQEALVPRALELAETIASRPAPAVRMAKSILRHGSQMEMDALLQEEIKVFKKAMRTPEHGEAVNAMMKALAGK
jgi:2-(1,2-epoxy-1,2-dihydrophenyl)acetyl-CoA isomerase